MNEYRAQWLKCDFRQQSGDTMNLPTLHHHEYLGRHDTE